jgi:hypothetical protein
MTQLAASFMYIETTIAPGVTVSDYRRARTLRRSWRLRVVAGRPRSSVHIHAREERDPTSELALRELDCGTVAGDHWGPHNPESAVIPGNRIQPKTAEPTVNADCLDDCHAEGRGFESHQPLARSPLLERVLRFVPSHTFPRKRRLPPRFGGAHPDGAVPSSP